ncbi:MAG: hypothetical protein OEQ29_00975 [Alphaproteobacteria bacterium]|nr:hypothetical protein [Alphaproteobacteria bacterium]
MAEPPPGPRLTPEDETGTQRRLRRSILIVIVLFAGYGIITTLSEKTPGWIKLGPEKFPAQASEVVFADGVLAAAKPYVIRIKRTGRKRRLPPQRMQLAMVGATRATYRCAKRTRCPWIRIAPLRCRLDDAAPTTCGFELYEFGRTGIEILPRRRCRLTRPGIRDLDVGCPRTVTLGARLAPAPAAKAAPKPGE